VPRTLPHVTGNQTDNPASCWELGNGGLRLRAQWKYCTLIDRLNPDISYIIFYEFTMTMVMAMLMRMIKIINIMIII
jgi:hypothetical protein